jgi:hypothetical protein
MRTFGAKKLWVAGSPIMFILEMNGEIYGLKQSKSRRHKTPKSVAGQAPASEIADPETGEITTV